MKKLFITLLCCGVVMCSAAQKIEVKEPQLIKEAGTAAFYPKFTPDGKTLLLTSQDYSGLKTINLETRKVEILTTAPGAGWNAVISDDSKTVCFEKMDFSSDPWGVKTFHTVDLASKQIQPVMSPQIVEVKPLTLMRAKAAIQSPAVAFVNEDLKIVLEKDGKQTILTPNGADETYIWVELSPDGKKIAYFASSMNEAFVCDLSGKVLASLGELRALQWLNNKWVIGMNDLDDGHTVTKSNIVGITADGKVKQALTDPDGLVAMFPAASPAGDKIAFNTLEGKLYIMDVVVK